MKLWQPWTIIKEAVVIGAGFIGIEMAENLAKRGLQSYYRGESTLCLAAIRSGNGSLVQAELVKNGVQRHHLLSLAVSVLKTKEKSSFQKWSERIASDLTILSVGVKPENGLKQVYGD